MQVTFTHPRSAKTVAVELDGACSGAAALEQLTKAGFLEPTSADRPYSLTLTKNNAQILPNATFEAAGVAHGDTLAVNLDGKGAARAS